MKNRTKRIFGTKWIFVKTTFKNAGADDEYINYMKTYAIKSSKIYNSMERRTA